MHIESMSILAGIIMNNFRHTISPKSSNIRPSYSKLFGLSMCMCTCVYVQ